MKRKLEIQDEITKGKTRKALLKDDLRNKLIYKYFPPEIFTDSQLKAEFK